MLREMFNSYVEILEQTEATSRDGEQPADLDYEWVLSPEGFKAFCAELSDYSSNFPAMFTMDEPPRFMDLTIRVEGSFYGVWQLNPIVT